MISVILPTIRPHLLRTCLESIGPAAAGVSYEVIVISDKADPGEYKGTLCDQWVVRDRQGVIDAIYAGASLARGTYLFVFNDESVLEPGALKTLHDVAEQNPEQVLTPEHVPPYPFFYYGRPFAPFPFVHRRVVDRIGGLFDTAFKGFYADPDFSMRAHAHGVPVREVAGAVIRHSNKHDLAHEQSVSAYLAADRALFRSRWDHLGEFRDP